MRGAAGLPHLSGGPERGSDAPAAVADCLYALTASASAAFCGFNSATAAGLTC